MDHTATAQEFFELWKKGLDEGTQFWSRAGGTDAKVPGGLPDPLGLWRPFMEQAAGAWSKTMSQAGQPAGAGDTAAQGKAFLEQWIGAWDKLLADTMQTEAFAEAMGKHLDQWLSVQGPAQKAAADGRKSALEAMGLPSRDQVIAITRQLMDLDDRLEDIEDSVAALRAHLDPPPVKTTPPGSKRAATKRKKKPGEGK